MTSAKLIKTEKPKEYNRKFTIEIELDKHMTDKNIKDYIKEIRDKDTWCFESQIADIIENDNDEC